MAEDLISEFLPIIPDDTNYGFYTERTYGYDNDNDVFVNPSNCYAFSGINWRGVNLVYHLDIDPDSSKWTEITEYMDNAVDNGDGPYCGSLRFHNGQINYMIDNDQTPDF